MRQRSTTVIRQWTELRIGVVEVAGLIEECRAMNLVVVPPDVAHSAYPFTVRDDGAVVYGLGAIKGVGEAAVAGIVEACQRSGPFKDLFDFCRRIDLKKAKQIFAALIFSFSLVSLLDLLREE